MGAAQSAEGGAPGTARGAPAGADACPMAGAGAGAGAGGRAPPPSPFARSPFGGPPPAGGSACPVVGQEGGSQGEPVYNVYSERINPLNRVPTGTNRPGLSPQQKVPLSTGRVQSTIPKGGTDGQWTYPSPQMFYNALMRKGKGGDVQESDVADVVSVHNAMNERTWRQVLDFERLHEAECGTPRLTRFEGRPFDLSPLARLYTLMGYTAPFDRHDWYVDRCGKQVRYVIDFYYDEAQGVEGEGADAGATGETPTGAAMRMITVDARPALDSPEAAWDRLRKWMAGPSSVASVPTSVEQPRTAEEREAAQVPALGQREGPAAAKMRQLQSDCAPCFKATQTCEDEIACYAAGAALELCMARVLCPAKADRLAMAMDRNERASSAAAEVDGVGGVRAWWRRRGAAGAARAEDRARSAVQTEIESFRAKLRKEVGLE